MANRKKLNVVADCIYADSDNNPDQRYLTGIVVPDNFLTLAFGKRSFGVFSDLELNRAKTESRLTEILSLTTVKRATSKWLNKKNPNVPDIIAWLMDFYAIDSLRVPENFPAWLLEGVRKHDLDCEVSKGAFFKARHIKSIVESEMVREGNRCSAAGFQAVRDILVASEIQNGFIHFEGEVLTSERLREAIEIAALKLGGVAQRTIVAGGDQACDPHCIGHGPLMANSLIIVDIFPRMKMHGYFGDMTRTFLKGTPSEAQRTLVEAVKEAHGLAISLVRGGIQGNKVHQAVKKLFKDLGYKTRLVKGVPTGFFHTTGHGLGLEIHEPLRIGDSKVKFKPGNVLTVEPGLYYPGLGGCRVEDVVWVTKSGCELLSKAPYDWKIP